MLMPTIFHKTLLALACSASLLGCGGAKPEATADLAPRPAPAAAPAPAAQEPQGQPRARKDTSAVSKMMAEKASLDSSFVSVEEAAAAPPAGRIPAAAIANGLAASEAALKGRQLVLTASARFGVKNAYTSALAIEDAVVANDGYVVANHIDATVLQQTQHRGDDGQLVKVAQVVVTGKLVVRVPSAKAQSFLRDIASQIDTLDQRNFNARDVQFDMLRRQLEAARNQETQAELGLLNQQKGTVGDKAAAVDARNQAKAARDEARINSSQLADQVAYSTVTLHLQQPAQVRTTQTVDFEAASAAQRPNFVSNLGRAMASGWQGLLRAVVWAVGVWPLWLVLAAGASMAMAYRARNQRK